MADPGLEAILAHYAASNRGDYAACLELMAPDIEWDGSAWVDGAVYRGYEGVARAARSWLGAFPDQRLDVELVERVGPHYVIAAHATGHSRAHGIEAAMDFWLVWTLRRGRAVRHRQFFEREQAIAFARSDPPDPLPSGPIVMGVVNVTPDSFSDGGEFFEPDAAVAQGERLAVEGAAILDIGGESTRPGAEPVREDEELRRVMPVVERLATGESGAWISIDTSKLEVARQALAAGARVVNDVAAFRSAPEMAAVVAESGAHCVLMHMLGEPRTMQSDPRYDDVVADVKAFLEERLAYAVSEGVPEERVWLDPGIGFGKTPEDNVELLRRLDEIVAIGRPVVIGTSRKSFIGKLTGAGEAGRVPGTIASNVLALERGARVFRVHDVAENRQALELAAATLG